MPTGTMTTLFVESSSSSSSSSGSGRGAEPAVLCAPRPRRAHAQPCTADLILGPPPFLINSSSAHAKKQREGKSKTHEEEDEEEGGWSLFGGSPPARADNPLVHDPHFLLNQRHHEAAVASDFNLAVFDQLHHHSRTHLHVPAYSNSNSNSSHSFGPSCTHAPAVRIQGFDVAACRGSHSSSGGGRVLSARA